MRILHSAAQLVLSLQSTRSPRTATKSENKVQYGACSDVEIFRHLVILHLPSAKDEALLGRRHAGLLLYFLLNAGDLVLWVNVELDLFARQRLDFD